MALWLMLTYLLASLSVEVLSSLVQRPLKEKSDHRALKACQSLAARFPELVSFPRNVQYEQEQTHYWSSRQVDLKPACRLTPATSDETSELLQYLNHHDIDIAVVSGGHSTAAGASNLDAGVTLDLSLLSSISIAEDQTLIEVGTGARWLDVYQLLDSQRITVAGAREGSVGVGGFLLGGGISTSAARYGWSCDTVDSVELVLANGSVLHANPTSHADVFRSLKGGGSNFGIATSFKVRTFAFDVLQVAFIRYGWKHISQLMHGISALTQKAHEDPESAFDLSIALDPTSRDLSAFLMLTRFGEISTSPTLQPLFDIPHLSSHVETVMPNGLAYDMDLNNPRGYRQYKCTMTIQNDAATALGIARTFASVVTQHALAKDDAYRPGLLLQAITQAQIHRKIDPTGNVLGLDNEKEPLLLISFEVRWSLPDLDDLYVDLFNDLLIRCQSVAERHAKLHSFVYLNYAAAEQDGFAMLRHQQRISHLKTIQDRYDPNHYLENHLRQPFKLAG